jgi:hypothetical protein
MHEWARDSPFGADSCCDVSPGGKAVRIRAGEADNLLDSLVPRNGRFRRWRNA